jgi:hypothetical protein
MASATAFGASLLESGFALSNKVYPEEEKNYYRNLI